MSQRSELPSALLPTYVGSLSLRLVGEKTPSDDPSTAANDGMDQERFFFAPPAYLFPELPLLDSLNGLAAEGFDPIVQLLRQGSSWPLMGIDSLTGQSHLPSRRALPERSAKEALHHAVAKGQLPFLYSGTSGAPVSQCTSESLVQRIQSVAKSASGLAEASHEAAESSSVAVDRELETLMMSQYFLDVMAWQRLEQLDQVLLDLHRRGETTASSNPLFDLSSAGDAMKAVYRRASAKRGREEEADSLDVRDQGVAAPSKTPWSDEAGSVSFSRTVPLSEQTQLFTGLSALIGERWCHQRSSAVQTDFQPVAPVLTRATDRRSRRLQDEHIPINSTSPYVDLSRVDRPIPVPNGHPEPNTNSVEDLGIRVELLDRHKCLEVLREVGGSQLSEGASSTPYDAELAKKLASCALDHTNYCSVHLKHLVTSFGRAEEHSAAADIEGAFECVAENGHCHVHLPTVSRKVALHHFTIQLLPGKPVSAATPAPSIYIKSYGMNGVRILTQHRWISGDCAALHLGQGPEILSVAGEVFLCITTHTASQALSEE
jgi:hypothetical protein